MLSLCLENRPALTCVELKGVYGWLCDHACLMLHRRVFSALRLKSYALRMCMGRPFGIQRRGLQSAGHISEEQPSPNKHQSDRHALLSLGSYLMSMALLFQFWSAM